MAISLDQSLVHIPYVESAKVEPLNTFYQDIQADQNTSSGLSFFVQNPASGALLDNEVYIKYELWIGAKTFLDTDRVRVKDMYYGGIPLGRLALRQGTCMARGMNGIQLNINGTVLSSRPNHLSDAYMRMYGTHSELHNINTMSGGEPDTGLCDGATPALQAAYRGVPPVFHSKILIPPDDTAAAPALGDRLVGSSDIEKVAHTVNNWSGDLIDMTDVDTARVEGQYTQEKNFYSQIPHQSSDYGLNEGLDKRHQRLYQAWKDTIHKSTDNRTQPFNSAAERNEGQEDPGAIKLTVYERVPISPFLWYELKDGKRSIPNIRQMNLDINWSANAPERILQQCFDITWRYGGLESQKAMFNGDTQIRQIATALDQYYVRWYRDSLTHPSPKRDICPNPPVLQLKWYIPPAGFFSSIPQEITMRIQDPVVYLSSQQKVKISFSDGGLTSIATGEQVTFNNIRLNQIPDYFLIYVRQDPNADLKDSPSDQNMEIIRCEIKLDGDAGKVIAADQGELYHIWLRNSPGARDNVYPYDYWRKAYCNLLFRPHDLGMRFGPGINHPVTLDIVLSVRSVARWGDYGAFTFDRQNSSVDTNEMVDGSYLSGANEWKYVFNNNPTSLRGTKLTQGSNFWDFNDHSPLAKPTGDGANPITKYSSVEIPVQIVFVAIYDKVELMLNKEGGSARRLQQIPKSALSAEAAETFNNQAGSNVRLLDVLQ